MHETDENCQFLVEELKENFIQEPMIFFYYVSINILVISWHWSHAIDDIGVLLITYHYYFQTHSVYVFEWETIWSVKKN